MTVNTAKFLYHITMWNSSFRWVQRPSLCCYTSTYSALYLIPWHVTQFCSHPNTNLQSSQKCFLPHLFNTSFTNHCIIYCYIIQVTGSALKQIKNTLIKITIWCPYHYKLKCVILPSGAYCHLQESHSVVLKMLSTGNSQLWPFAYSPHLNSSLHQILLGT